MTCTDEDGVDGPFDRAMGRAMKDDDLVRRWARLKARVLALKRERERCEVEVPPEYGENGHFEPGDPPCWSAGMEGKLSVSEFCPACQRNQARYLYRQYTQKALAQVQRRVLKVFGAEAAR